MTGIITFTMRVDTTAFDAAMRQLRAQTFRFDVARQRRHNITKVAAASGWADII